MNNINTSIINTSLIFDVPKVSLNSKFYVGCKIIPDNISDDTNYDAELYPVEITSVHQYDCQVSSPLKLKWSIENYILNTYWKVCGPQIKKGFEFL